MKKFLSFLCALLAFGGSLEAQTTYVDVEDYFSVGTNNIVEIENGEECFVAVNIATHDQGLRNSEFVIYLPEGVNAAKDTDGTLDVLIGDGQPKNSRGIAYYVVSARQDDKNPQKVNVVVKNDQNVQTVNDGELMRLYVTIDDNITVGSELTGSLSDMMISNSDATIGYRQASLDFTIKVGGTIPYSDTEGYEDFTPATNVNVNVKRAVKEGTWNTICLPFAMSEDKIHAVFGDNAKVADFTGCETKWTESEDRVTGINASFTLVDKMEAHHPYLLKIVDEGYAKNATDGFIVEDVNVVSIPEGGARVDVTETDLWSDSFIGTYQPIDDLGDGEKPVVFLSDNKFYYVWSGIGTASIKGFRGYFEFECLDLYLDTNDIYSSNLSFFVDGEEVTSIEGISTNILPSEGVFDLQGRKVEVGENGANGLQKGIYIVNGKKVTVK